MREVWIYLPPLFPTRGEPEERGRARELAEAAGFEIIDLTGAFEGIDVDTLVLEEWDRHPNARAHEIIAGRIYEAMQARPGSFSLPAILPAAVRCQAHPHEYANQRKQHGKRPDTVNRP